MWSGEAVRNIVPLCVRIDHPSQGDIATAVRGTSGAAPEHISTLGPRRGKNLYDFPN